VNNGAEVDDNAYIDFAVFTSMEVASRTGTNDGEERKH
jgi:hypothetical protein